MRFESFRCSSPRKGIVSFIIWNAIQVCFVKSSCLLAPEGSEDQIYEFVIFVLLLFYIFMSPMRANVA